MTRTNLKIAALALAVASTAAGTAHAAGFQLTEQSALGLGRAYAGIGVDGTDISGIYYNPASMTLHTGTQVQLGGVGMGLNLEYVHADGSKNNGRAKEEFVPHGFISHQINDSTWIGLAVTVPFGLATNYGNDFKAKDRGTDAEMLVVDFNPNMAWKLNDKFSIGAGVSFQYVEAKFGLGHERIHGEYEASNNGWTYNVGMMYSPAENLRFGLSYRSEAKHKTRGTVNVDGTTGGAIDGSYNAEVTVSGPAWAMFSAAWDVNTDFSLYATVRWADWSSFKTLDTESAELTGKINGMLAMPGLPEDQKNLITGMLPVIQGMTHIENNWKDTYLVSLGYDWRVNDFWTLRGGIAYETSPLDDSTKRTAIIPDADRWWFAIGSSFHWTKNMQTDVGFTHLHGVHERSLYDNNGETIGRYRHLDAYLLGVQMQYRF